MTRTTESSWPIGDKTWKAFEDVMVCEDNSELTLVKDFQLRPAVFLDRDGTLIEDRGHLRSPSEVVFFADTVNALRRLQSRFLLFIVTHQPGVAEGVITTDDVEQVNLYVLAQLAEEGVEIATIYVCPHRRTDDCPCVKPRPYFLYSAARDYDVDLRRSFTIGDHPHDVELAASVGAQGVYVCTGHGRKHRNELARNQVVVADIGEAAEWILSQQPP